MTISIDASAQERLRQLLDQGVSLPSMPAANMDLLAMLRRPADSIDMRRLAESVEHDPPLSARLLRVANSPYYGARRGVTRVGQAVMMLGLNETLSILNYYVLRRAFDKIPVLPHFSMDDFWRHSLAVGTVARILGQPKYLVATLPGELYTAGLLHDIGKLVLAIHMPERYGECLEQAWQTGMPLHEAERQVFGLDHAMIGGQLLDNWNLPTIILDGVAFHHDPEASDPQHRECGAIVQFVHAILGDAKIMSASDPETIDFSQTWLCRYRPDCPLSNQSLHEALVTEARKELETRVQAFDDADVQAREDDDGSSRSPAPAPAPGATRAEFPLRALWDWLRGMIGR